MVARQLIVCERTGTWALAWRKALSGVANGLSIRLIETRSLDDCRPSLVETPAAVVSLEMRADNLETVGELLTHCEDAFPTALILVTADRSLEHVAELAREAGAAWFATSPRQLQTMASVACRHWIRQPQPNLSLQKRVWEQLPWSKPGG